MRLLVFHRGAVIAAVAAAGGCRGCGGGCGLGGCDELQGLELVANEAPHAVVECVDT
jgi:hypothetical protein